MAAEPRVAEVGGGGSVGSPALPPVPLAARRALELFQDNRFKPRVVHNRKIYTRKGRQGHG